MQQCKNFWYFIYTKEIIMQENTTEIPTYKLPLIGDKAPAFQTNTTNGTINFPEDFKGHWVVLFSHPMDFTPVCTTEFLAFQTQINDFHKLDTDIIGLSVGGIPSHLAWFRSIHDDIKFQNKKNIEITFPVIADLDLHIAKMYGMIHPETSETKTVRAVFIIDPKGIIRTILYYPQTTGRNIKEILRILMALRTTDAFAVSTPADWMPGEKVIEPAPQTAKDMNQRIKQDDKNINVLAWYLALRDLPKDKVYDKIVKK